MIKGFKMKLSKGYEEEYKKRHDKLWPEMRDMIRDYGGSNYTIFLDTETNTLFGYVEIADEKKWSESAETEVCKQWCRYMSDIMEKNVDGTAVNIPLREVFHLD